MRLLTALVFCAAVSAPAAAQDFLGEYYTSLGTVDLYNSKGQRLTNFCAVVQQDRANFHRFGKAEQGDMGDPFFGNRAARATLGQNCRVMPGHEYIPEWVLSGRTRYIWVRVFGYGRTPSYVEIREGAG